MSERFWSVTTLIGAGVPKPALVGWAAKVTAEWAVDHEKEWKAALEGSGRDIAVERIKNSRFDVMRRAAIRGSDVHKVAEAISYGEKPPITDVEAYAEQYLRFLEQFAPTFELAEAPVYSPSWRYAGTLDSVVTIDGQRCVLDIKTTDKAPGDTARPPYPEVALQLCAYRRAELVGLAASERVEEQWSRRYYVYDPESTVTAPMPQTDGALCLVVSPYDYQLHPVRTDEEVWASFLHCMWVARWASETSKHVIGSALQAKEQAA